MKVDLSSTIPACFAILCISGFSRNRFFNFLVLVLHVDSTWHTLMHWSNRRFHVFLVHFIESNDLNAGQFKPCLFDCLYYFPVLVPGQNFGFIESKNGSRCCRLTLSNSIVACRSCNSLSCELVHNFSFSLHCKHFSSFHNLFSTKIEKCIWFCYIIYIFSDLHHY